MILQISPAAVGGTGGGTGGGILDQIRQARLQTESDQTKESKATFSSVLLPPTTPAAKLEPDSARLVLPWWRRIILLHRDAADV